MKQLPISSTLMGMNQSRNTDKYAFHWTDDLEFRGDRPGWEGGSYKVVEGLV